jgi:hypothetical protein
MRLIRYFLHEAGGEAPGKLEVHKTTADQAIEYCEKKGFDILTEVPDFRVNYARVQELVKIGQTKRKDMPVIDTDDVKKFQKRLEDGKLDINRPFADDPLVKSNPFPTGLSGLDAKKWMELGLQDGDEEDDKIDVNISKVRVSVLKPIQKQIYFDKAADAIIKFGIKGSMEFVTKKSFFILSSNNFIIDGHHRWLSGNIINPRATIFGLKIDLPINKLLPLATAYGDAIGNKRNL